MNEENKKKIKDFIKDGKEKVLLLEHNDTINTLFEWSRIANPIRSLFNYAVIGICKYLPFGIKVHILRLLSIKIGKNVGIAIGTEFDPLYPQLISIKNNALIGWNVNMLCHEFTEKTYTPGQNNCWKEFFDRSIQHNTLWR